MASIELVDLPGHGGAEAQIVENSGAQLKRHAAHLFQCLHGKLAQLLHPLAGLVRVLCPLE